MTYQRDLKKVTKKHPNTTKTVCKIIKEIEAKGIPAKALRMVGLNKAPVYKIHTRIGRFGKHRGRFIFHYENGNVVPLFIFFKGDREDVTSKEIIKAMRAAGL